MKHTSFFRILRRNLFLALIVGAAFGFSSNAANADSMVGFWNFDGETHLEMTAGPGATGDWGTFKDGVIFNTGVSFANDSQLKSTIAQFSSQGGIDIGVFPQVGVNDKNFTLSAMVSCKVSNSSVIMGNRYPDVSGGYNFMKLTPASWEYNIAGSAANVANVLGTDSQWKHVALVRDGDKFTYYLNGSVVGTSTVATGMTGSIKFGLGGDVNNKTEQWGGALDSVSIYSTAATQANLILQASARYSGLTSYWSADDYVEGSNWVDRVGGKVADFAPSDLTAGTNAKFEFNRTLTTSETAWYADAAKSNHVYDTSGSWNTTAPTVPTTGWVYSGTVDYAAPTAPTGIYVGGGTAAAALNLTAAQLNGINLTLALTKGTITTSGSEINYTKTLNIDGGTVDLSVATFNMASGSRITVATGSLTTDYLRVGQRAGSAELVQYNGSVKTGNLHIGDNSADANGTYTIYNGSLSTAQLCAGQYQGTGTLNVYGGTVNATNTLLVGNASGSKGFLNIYGGTVKVTGELALGKAATNSTGTVNISGGTVNVSSAVKIGALGTGIASISGGTITAPEIIVGMDGKGTLNYKGGTLDATKITVNSTGTFDAGSITLNLGASRAQTLTINGGAVKAGALYFGSANNATVVITAGSLTTVSSTTECRIGGIDSNNTASATVKQSGGTVTSVYNLQIGAYGAGTYELTGGTLNTSQWFALGRFAGGNGTLTVSGTGILTHKDSNAVIVAENGVGNLNIKEGGAVNITSSNSGNSLYIGLGAGGKGTLNVEGGTLSMVGNLVVGNNATAEAIMNVSSGKTTIGGALAISNLNANNKVTFSGGYLSANSLSGADRLTWTDGMLAIGESVSGNLNQQGGTLMVGVPTFESGLNWKRNEFATISEGYPGWSSDWNRKKNADNTDYLVTSAENDTFWNKVSKTAPVASGMGTIADSVSGLANEKKYFTVVATADLWIDTTGTYYFSEKSDDGAFLLIDGKEIISTSTMKTGNAWGFVDTNSVELTAGYHSLELRYYQGFGGWGVAGAGQQSSFLSWGTSADSLTPLESSGVLFNYDPVYAHISMTDDYTQAKDATLVFEINPITGEYDSITMDGGKLTMNGVLALAITGDSSQPFEFDIFQALNGADLNFNFDSIQFMDGYANGVLWNLDGVLAGGDGVLRYAGVPEPTTWALLVLGAGGVFVLRRKLLGARR